MTFLETGNLQIEAADVSTTLTSYKHLRQIPSDWIILQSIVTQLDARYAYYTIKTNDILLRSIYTTQHHILFGRL